MVRVSAQSQPAGSAITIGLGNAWEMPDDPANVYFAPPTDPAVNVAFIQVVAADTITYPPGRLYLKNFNNTCAGMFFAFMSVTTAATPGAVSINCGIDVVLRDA